MSDQRRLGRRSGKLVTAPIPDFWQIGLTVQDPSIPNLPLETPSGGSSAQDLTPGLFSNSQTFYAATVTTGLVNLAPGLFSNTNTFYAPTVWRGAASLTPDLFSNTQTFYGPTVDQSSPAQDLTPSLFGNESLFYSAVVSSGVIPNAISGGIGHGKRRKRHFLERDGEILLFDKAIDVEIYLYQESLVKEEPKKVRRSIKKAKKVEPQVLNKEALQKFVEVQEIQENVYELARIDIELLLDIYRKYEMWTDEQDVEILLLH